MTKKIVATLACLAALAGTAHAGNVDFSLGINLGLPPVPVRIEPAYAPPPPPVVIAEPPRFILSPRLGFYAAVDTPYDLFYAGNRYYLSRGGRWFGGPSYRGPWTVVEYRALPWEIRRYPVEKIRFWREREYRRYRDDDDHGRWRTFRPDGDWRDRHEERERWREARRWDRRPAYGRWHERDDD
ncbi:hypothetical protein [Geobacter sp.]|uniref:hypothetical protein n=1 Tax=Geobacter sp. TaxID=46610 RepID=UPI0026129CF7|nr:hypothetical protein [Geobacter sp.]